MSVDLKELQNMNTPRTCRLCLDKLDEKNTEALYYCIKCSDELKSMKIWIIKNKSNRS